MEHEKTSSGDDLVVDVDEMLDDHLGVPHGFRHPERPWLVSGVGGRLPRLVEIFVIGYLLLRPALETDVLAILKM